MDGLSSKILMVEHILADMDGREFDAAKVRAVEGREYDLMRRLIVYCVLRGVQDVQHRVTEAESLLEELFRETD